LRSDVRPIGCNGRQRHACDPQRRCDHRWRSGRDLGGVFPAQTWPLGYGDREGRGRQPGERGQLRQCPPARAPAGRIPACASFGAEVLELTRAVEIEATGSGFRLVTDREIAIEAPFIINAAGAWGNEIAEKFGETSPMFPAAPPHFVTEPLPYFVKSALQAVD